MTLSHFGEHGPGPVQELQLVILNVCKILVSIYLLFRLIPMNLILVGLSFYI